MYIPLLCAQRGIKILSKRHKIKQVLDSQNIYIYIFDKKFNCWFSDEMRLELRKENREILYFTALSFWCGNVITLSWRDKLYLFSKKKNLNHNKSLLFYQKKMLHLSLSKRIHKWPKLSISFLMGILSLRP